jgi:pyridoxine kinase
VQRSPGLVSAIITGDFAGQSNSFVAGLDTRYGWRAQSGPAMNILSIQSHVAYGHVGNAAATFPLQRIGVEVWPIHTVQFSNHTGYGAWTGQVFDAGLITDLVRGIAERGALGRCDGVLSGYMGSADTGAAILDAVAQVKAASTKARYCCDPVIGDVGRGIYVRPGIPEFMRNHALPAADVATPNQFELELLSGGAVATKKDAIAALDVVHKIGPKVLLVTSLHTEETPGDAIDLVASHASGRYRVRTPKLPISVNGAGDAIAALFFAHHTRTGSAAEALSRAASSVFGVLKRTAEAGSREILLVDAQEEFVKPTRVFVAEPM